MSKTEGVPVNRRDFIESTAAGIVAASLPAPEPTGVVITDEARHFLLSQCPQKPVWTTLSDEAANYVKHGRYITTVRDSNGSLVDFEFTQAFQNLEPNNG